LLRRLAKKNAANDFKLLLFIIAIMWGLEIVNMIFDHSLNHLALVPRQPSKFFGILAMHFLHWNIPHLLSNTLPLAILGFLVCVNGKAKQITVSIMLITGLSVWLFARDGVHAGASGLVLGYWGYLLSGAFFERSFRNILIAMVTFLVYGGVVISLLDFRDSTSFEGHIFGFMAGVFSAWFWRNDIKANRHKNLRSR